MRSNAGGQFFVKRLIWFICSSFFRLILEISGLLNPNKLIELFYNVRVLDTKKLTTVFISNKEKVLSKRSKFIPKANTYLNKHKYTTIPESYFDKKLVLVLTDVIDSTWFWNNTAEAMYKNMKRHDTIARRLIKKYSGLESKNEGDSFLVLFNCLSNACRFSEELICKIEAEEWEDMSSVACSPSVRESFGIRCVVNQGTVVLKHENVLSVYGNTVDATYFMSNFAHKNKICINLQLYADMNFTRQNERLYCTHKNKIK